MKAICVLVLLTRVATAEPSSAELAAKANEAGKDLFGGQNLVEASGKFRAAVMLDPQAKYYFNLCEALDRRDVFAAALEACKAVAALHPTSELATKTEKYIGASRRTRRFNTLRSRRSARPRKDWTTTVRGRVSARLGSVSRRRRSRSATSLLL